MSGRLHESHDSEDEFDLSSSNNSKLNALFQTDVSDNRADNQTLIYKAPIQPVSNIIDTSAKNEVQATGASDFKVIFATAVHAFQASDGKYTSRGKVGVAILGNTSLAEFQLLLYVSKQQPLVKISLTDDFDFKVLPNNYVQFYDESSVAWSILFERDTKMFEFLRWSLVAKSSLSLVDSKNVTSKSESPPNVIIQDVFAGTDQNSQPIDLNDQVELEYSEMLVDGLVITEYNGSSTEGGSRPLRLKIGKGKVPNGWETGLIGMRKGGKRYFALLPSVPTSTGGVGESLVSMHLPPGPLDDAPINLNDVNEASAPITLLKKPLLVYVHLKRVKFAKTRSRINSASTSELSKPIQLPDSTEVGAVTDSNTNGELVDEADVSTQPNHSEDVDATEQSTSNDDTLKHSNLVNRMAKLGQPMFPTAATTAAVMVENDSLLSPQSDVRSHTTEIVVKGPALAVFCASVSMPSTVVTQSTASSMVPEKVLKQDSSPITFPAGGVAAAVPPFTGSGQQHPAQPYMYPYAMPYVSPWFVPPTTTNSNDLQSQFFRPPFCPQFFSPYLGSPHGQMPPGTQAQMDENMNPHGGSISGVGNNNSTSGEKDTTVMQDIQQSQIQLQDVLTRLLSNHLSGFGNKLEDAVQRLANIPSTSPDANSVDVLNEKLDRLLRLKGSSTEDLTFGGGLSPSPARKSAEPSNIDSIDESLKQVQNALDDIACQCAEIRTLTAGESLVSGSVAENVLKKLDILAKKLEELQRQSVSSSNDDLWKEKYEKLKSQALLIKDKYEERINLLNQELQLNNSSENIEKLVKAREQQRVRKIMNSFYKRLDQNIDAGASYSGADVMKISLDAIKNITMEVLNEEFRGGETPEEVPPQVQADSDNLNMAPHLLMDVETKEVRGDSTRSQSSTASEHVAAIYATGPPPLPGEEGLGMVSSGDEEYTDA